MTGPTTYHEASTGNIADQMDRYRDLAQHDALAGAIAIGKARGTYEPNEHVNDEKFPPLTITEHLEMLALGERIARYYRHPSQVDQAVKAGATWDQIAGATGGDPDQARQAYREWAKGQHRLRSDFPGGTIGLGDEEYAAALEAAGDSPEPEGDEVRIQLPASSVIVTYASQCERDRSLRLAEARQGIAERTGYIPPWAELAEGDREMATLEARNWLRAALRCGIAAPGSGAGAEEARRLNAIRGVLARFDWEHADRQLALEAIERIADGGQP
jgi:hypothetical protein